MANTYDYGCTMMNKRKVFTYTTTVLEKLLIIQCIAIKNPLSNPNPTLEKPTQPILSYYISSNIILNP